MQQAKISRHDSYEALTTDTRLDLTALIRLGKLSTDDIALYDGWLLARTASNDQLLGCVGVELRPPHAYMESLVVHPDARRQGIGRELTDRLFKLYVVENPDICDLTAMTLFWNNRFYESLGFRRIDPSIAKQADDVASKEKHHYCTVWRKTPDAPTESQARTKKKPGH